jgi:hypothetical protein
MWRSNAAARIFICCTEWKPYRSLHPARTPDRSYLSAATTAAKELLAAIGFQP